MCVKVEGRESIVCDYVNGCCSVGNRTFGRLSSYGVYQTSDKHCSHRSRLPAGARENTVSH